MILYLFSKEETVCFNRLGFLKQMDFFTECKTDYAYQKVYVYYIGQKTFTWAYIRRPVSCSCVISRRAIVDNPYDDDCGDFCMEDSTSRNI